MPLTDPVPSSSFDVLERNVQDTDKFVNQETGTFTNRVGKVIKPIPVIESEANAAVISLGWHQVGLFVDGFTYLLQNDIAKDTAGDWYRWNGTLPKVVTAGTLPSSDANFVKIDYKSHADLSDRNPADGTAHNADDVAKNGGGSVQDFIDAQSITTSEIATRTFTVGTFLRVVDRDMGIYKMMPPGLTPNGIDILPSLGGTSAEYQIINGKINVNEIGAKPTLRGDETFATINKDVFNRAFVLAFSKSDPFPTVCAGSGVYYTDGTILKSGSGNYVDFLGLGQRNTIIMAATTFVGDTVVKLGLLNDVTGRTKIDSMTIDGNNSASYCLDASEMKYFYQDNLELIGAKIASQISGNWVISLNNTRYAGRVGLIHKGTSSFLSSSNNFKVLGGDFTGCQIGVITTEVVNDLTFDGCNFDLCTTAAYRAEKGIKSVRFIGGTTFERCGIGAVLTTSTFSLSDVSTTMNIPTNYSLLPSTGHFAIEREIVEFTKTSPDNVSLVRGQFGTIAVAHPANVQVKYIEDPSLARMQVSASAFEAALAPIVLGYIYNNLAQTSSKLHIADCGFNNTATQAMVIMYNCRNALIDESVDVLEGYNYDSFVELRGFGCFETETTGMKIRGEWLNVDRLVNLDGLAQNSTCAINADNGRSARGGKLFDITDPKTSDFVNLELGNATINKLRYMGMDRYEFDVIADGESFLMGMTVDFTACPNHPLRGRYVSFSMMSQGDGVSASGVSLVGVLNGNIVINITRTSLAYAEAARRYTMYIPNNATSFQIRIGALSNTIKANMIGFRVCDSALID